MAVGELLQGQRESKLWVCRVSSWMPAPLAHFTSRCRLCGSMRTRTCWRSCSCWLQSPCRCLFLSHATPWRQGLIDPADTC